MQLRKMKFLLIVFMILFTDVSAQTYTVDGLRYRLVTADGTTTAEVYQQPSSFSGAVNIPSSVTIEGTSYPVTSIGEFAFQGNDVTSLSMPSTITKIGGEAFDGCENLKTISIPSSVVSIGRSAFRNTGITSITIPKGVTDLNHNVIPGCKNLTTIKVASGNTKYDSRNSCNAIIETDNDELLSGCKSTVIPSDVSSIGDAAFDECTALTSISLPSSVRYICNSAFSGCENLQGITLPEKLTYIDDYAFYGCKALGAINIPSQVSTIGRHSFAYCSNLASISVASGNTSYDSRNNCNAIINTSSGSLIAGCVNTVIPTDITIIDRYAFMGCAKLNMIAIPDNIVTIRSYAFSGCTGLTEIFIPGSVTKIEGGAFEECTSLKTFDIPDGITQINAGLFAGCTGLEEIIIPSHITSIIKSAFENCSSLKVIKVEEGNTVYDSRNNCNAIIETASNLLLIGCAGTVIPSDVCEIGEQAFYGSGITSIEIPSSITVMNDRAFKSCQRLSNVVIKANVTNIPNHCFDKCSVLQTIRIPEGIKKIGDYAFYNCENLTTVIIPSTATSIGDDTFYRCPNLTSVTVAATTPPTLSSDSFSNRANATLYVPSGSISSYQSANFWKEFKAIEAMIEFEPGDANGDGKVNVADYIAIAHHIMGNTPEGFIEQAADVNGDGKVNVADYIAVAHLIIYGAIEKDK